jgi:hypothetical protein
MMEQGFYKDEKLIFHLKQFLRRSFGVGTKGTELDIREVCDKWTDGKICIVVQCG